VFTVLTSLVLANNDAVQLDRRLDSIVEASMYPEQLSDPSRGVLTTGRARSSGQVVFQRGFQLPRLPTGTATVEVNGLDYRVRTVPLDQQGGVLVSVGIRADSILLSPARIPLYTAVGVGTVVIAGGLGWLLAGPAIRPLRRLTAQTMRLGKGTEHIEAVTGVREAEELSYAMVDMLSRLTAAQQATTNSLQAAQDFAANAAHELRTPLTAMRADLDTLRIHDLPADERDEVVADLSRAQRRVEAIITALGQLASGQLAQVEDREVIDITDMLDRVARENARGDAVEVVVETGEDIGTIWGWPGGLRLAVDNLVRNAIAHGGATRIVLAAHRAKPSGEGAPAEVLTIVVDDNGRGLPVEEHEAVMGRFARGSTAAPGGSGLGLALVSQQAELHGGSIALSDGPMGGLRAILTLSTSPVREADSEQGETVSGEQGLLRRRASRVAGWRSRSRRRPGS
jgi:signal transduction histidine kinase